MSEVSKSTALITVDLDGLEKQKFIKELWLKERDDLIAELVDIETVDSDSELTVSGKLQTKAAKHLKELDKQRMEFKRPALDFGKMVDEQAKELRIELDEQVKRIKGLNSVYATKKAAEAEAERQRMIEADAERIANAANQAKATFGGMEFAVESDSVSNVGQVPETKVRTGSNAMVEVWEYEVEDIRLVFPEFLQINDKAVRDYIQYKKSLGDAPALPGIKFTKRIDVRSR